QEEICGVIRAHSECLVRFVSLLSRRHINVMNFGLGHVWTAPVRQVLSWRGGDCGRMPLPTAELCRTDRERPALVSRYCSASCEHFPGAIPHSWPLTAPRGKRAVGRSAGTRSLGSAVQRPSRR